MNNFLANISVLVLAVGCVDLHAQTPADPFPQQSSDPRSSSVELDPKIVSSFLANHCVKCHGPDAQEGETRLDTLSLQIANSDTALHWQEVLNVLNLGEMPPKDEPAPSDEALKKVLAHLTDAMTESQKRLAESGGDVALRRINRREYKYTIDQLFGLQVPDELLPPDDIAEGYDTVGQDQQFSSYHFEDYFSVAKTVAKVALQWADQPRNKSELRTFEPESRNQRLQDYVDDYDKKMARVKAGETFDQLGFDDEKQLQLFIKRYDARAGGRRRYLAKPYTDQGVFISKGTTAGERRATGFPKVSMDPRASYHFRIVAGLNGNPPTLRQFLKTTAGDRTLGYLKVDGSLESPSTREIEYRARLTDRSVGFGLVENMGAIKYDDYLKQLGDTERESAIWVDRLECEGPFYSAPSFFETSFQQALGMAGKKKNHETDEEKKNDDTAAKQILDEFMRMAFRGREPSPDYRERVFKVYQLHRQKNRSVKESLETPLAMILSSPSFLYLMENAPANEQGNLSDLELANRISHFLWSRPADSKLQTLVEKGSFSNPETLKSCVMEMLKHEHSWALSEGFFSQWSDLKRFDDIAINESDHVAFNSGVRHSARLEVQHLFDTMVKENMSLTQLIQSDFVMVNSLLAVHYGIEVSDKEVPDTGNKFQKVALPASSPRGGLLGTTAFLTMGSNGERSSPIIRGALVMEKFFNQKPSPPPPNVPELALASDKPLSVKETIDLHRAKAQCAACHSRFDPLGFGLENFDLLGQWREHEILGNIGKKSEKSSTRKPGKKRARKKDLIPIRAAGVFPNQTSFQNLQEFRAGLMEEKHLLTRSITEGLLSYGLGRHLEFADQQAIEEICKQASENNERIGDLIFTIVSHPIFKKADRPQESRTK